MFNRSLSFTAIALSLAALWAAPVYAQQQEKVWLGVAVQSLTRQDPYNSNRRIPAGVRIIKIYDDSPASDKFVRGDQLLTMDGRPILNAKMMFSWLAHKKPGAKVTFGVRRGNRRGTLTVKLDTRTQDDGGHTTTANSVPEAPSPSPQRQAAAEVKPQPEPAPAPAAKPEPAKLAAKPAKPEPKPVQQQAAAPEKPQPQQTAMANTPAARQQTSQQQVKAETAPAPAPAPASTPTPTIAVAHTGTPQPEAPTTDTTVPTTAPASQGEAPKPETAQTETSAPSPAPSIKVAQAETPQPEAAAATPAPKPQKNAGLEQSSQPAPYSSACDGIGVEVGILPTKTKKLCLKPGGGKKSGQSFSDCPKCPEMVVIPSGSFMMGSPKTEANDKNGDHNDHESPQHKVTIAKAFAVGKFEVTFDEWEACVADGGCPENLRRDHNKWGRGRRPVIFVRWKETRAYVKWLSQKTGHTYRLLSEAEWEYAARAGSKTAYWWGDKILSTQANFSYDVEDNGVKKYYGEPGGIIREKTLPVDEFKPNPWGLHQVHGNVWEWVEDCWHKDYKDKPEELKNTGAAWNVGDCFRRVQRGGSWKNIRYSARSASRGKDEFDLGFQTDLGFRIARDLKP
ncbi:MAG: SUMF1/EgtB/PvdO family nonheme iron enzyme [Alphaproteobacteria bacterium]